MKPVVSLEVFDIDGLLVAFGFDPKDDNNVIIIPMDSEYNVLDLESEDDLNMIRISLDNCGQTLTEDPLADIYNYIMACHGGFYSY